MTKEFSTGEKYINRELSWIAFNQRVLDQAFNPDMPLLERVRFFAISANNLNEFFRVRIGSLKFADAKGSRKSGIAGMTVSEQLKVIGERVEAFTSSQRDCFDKMLSPALEKEGIRCLTIDALSRDQKRWIGEHFASELHPLLDIIAVGDELPFPVLENSQVSLLVRFDSEAGLLKTSSGSPEGDRYALIVIRGKKEPLVKVPSNQGYEYIPAEEIVKACVSELFPETTIAECLTLRVIRNADFELNEEAGDFFQEMEQLLELREASHCVRLEISGNPSEKSLNFLKQQLNVGSDEISIFPGPPDFSRWMDLPNIPGYSHLKFPVWESSPVHEFTDNSSVFDVIAEKDRIVFHPYQSYDPVLKFLEQAADDPSVLSIKQTLYRTSRDSRIVKLLGRAAANGKRVTVILELKARFDEERNMQWAVALQREGVTVIYGVRGLKTHAKVCLVVRDEPDGLTKYAHFGTGNYNESTASLYVDISLFTADPILTGDALNVFNSVSGLTVPQPLERIAMAPVNLRKSLLELIEQETRNARGGIESTITARMNSLVDQEVIDALYAASQSGVKIRLNIRGICCLRPGIAGLSENIRVISIIDRYLEHSRVFHFRQGGENRVFISSADWMGRNLDRRVELLVPVDDIRCRKLLEHYLEVCFRDNVSAWELQSDGSYIRVRHGNRAPVRSQHQLLLWAKDQFDSATNPGTTVFKPIRPQEIGIDSDS